MRILVVIAFSCVIAAALAWPRSKKGGKPTPAPHHHGGTGTPPSHHHGGTKGPHGGHHGTHKPGGSGSNEEGHHGHHDNCHPHSTHISHLTAHQDHPLPGWSCQNYKQSVFPQIMLLYT
ncbi:hypothetical protein ANCDUO_17249 [Ancylostoma duodenale]|uniref:Uncharacterized protein n=1 Tax=Ancylostoma duodenale TaxID=51022 RepID=A0A0C2CS74_9BILA|nr:hypothetical protein ANCDUO_17249 [Ancylostoma duodenale]